MSVAVPTIDEHDQLKGAVAQQEARIADLEEAAPPVTVPPTPPYDDGELRAVLGEHQATLDNHEGRIRTLESAPPSGGGGSALGVKTPFNSFGANDSERFTNLATKMKAGWRGEVEFEVRVHNCPVQIPTAAGTRWSGTATPAGEFGTGTVINYTGSGSMFYLFKNSGYNYPSNGVSRDARFSGIQWTAGNDKDFLPPAPGGFDSNYVQWYWTFHDCGWVGWRRIINGWGTGLDLTGYTHWQACSQTPVTIGGSECKFFVGGGLVDSGNAAWMSADQPFLNWSASKSVIGSVMLSARNNSYQLRVTYGHNSRCIGTEFDSPDSNPTASYQVRFAGTATNFSFNSCSFKGGQGLQGISGATEVSVESCHFAGNRGLLRCENAFTGVFYWGLSNTYGSCPKIIYVARGSQVINGDPRVVVKSLDGSLTGIRNPDGTYTNATDSTGKTVPFGAATHGFPPDDGGGLGPVPDGAFDLEPVEVDG